MVKHGSLVAAMLLAWIAWGLPEGQQRAAAQQPQEIAPRVLAFYYPWYGNPEVGRGSGKLFHWSGIDEEKQAIASSTNYPELGPYDSHDPQLIARHCAWARESGIDGFIASWWGHGTFEDRALTPLLDACRQAGLSATVYYETVPDPQNADSAADDILKLLQRHADHPAWLRVDGKPVVFVYGRAVGEIGVGAWETALQKIRRQRPAFFVGDRFSEAAAKVFDGLHTYNTAAALSGKSLQEVAQWAQMTYPGWVGLARRSGCLSTITVIPGYDDTKIRTPGLHVDRFQGALYRTQWAAANEARPDWVLITSWNEWHEGSEIEPSVEHGRQYLDQTRRQAKQFKAGHR